MSDGVALTARDVLDHLVGTVFGTPILTNVHRSLVVEAITDLALGERWRWLGGYAKADFEREDGILLELKQSAARQTWFRAGSTGSKAVFDIAVRREAWSESEDRRVPNDQRHAQIYVFAHHSRIDDSADHREPSQWTFYPVLTNALPMQKQITLSKVMLLSSPVGFSELAMRVAELLEHAEG